MSDRRSGDDPGSRQGERSTRTGAEDVRDGEFELTEEQQAALDLDRNVTITAGAGTGKTTTLEERYRHILTEEPTVDPTNVVTLTFTRDAAAELRDGVREVIDKQLAATDRDDYDRWRRAKDAVEDAYVHTIHGFCSRVLREYAVEADVHPDFETLDETDAEVLATRVVGEVITAALGESGDVETLLLSEQRVDAVGGDVQRLARLYDRSELISLLQGLLSERPTSDDWADTLLGLTRAEYLEVVIGRTSPVGHEEAATLAERDDVLEALSTIQALAGREFPFSAEDDSGLATLNRIGEVLPSGGVAECTATDRQRLFLKICDIVTSNSGAVYAQSHYYAGSATRWREQGLEEENEALQAACETLIDTLNPEARDLDVNLEAAATAAPYVFALARLHQVVRDEYDRRKADRNALDYSDLIERTVEFLEVTDRARRDLRDQFAYVMIDEVQDTDPRQWDLVRLLTGTDSPEFDGENVFIVGDEKQSIYRFRQADVTMVRRTRDQLAASNPDGVEPDEELSGNFRSLPETLAFTNDLFDRVFEPEDPDEGYRPYEARPQRLTPERREGTEIRGTVEYLVTPARDEDVAALGMEGSWFDERRFETAADREAAAIAARLTRLFDDPPRVYDVDEDEYRPAESRDVALLFRTTTRLRSFERALEEFDVPYTSFGGQSLYDTPEIRPLVNLLCVLEDPDRDVSLYGVLRSPLFGFTDDELADLYHPEVSLWERLRTADGQLGTAAERIVTWRDASGVDEKPRTAKWGEFISRVVDESGYLVGIGADERPTQAVVNVNQFREILREWEEGAALPIADVLARIERERTFGDDVGEAEIPTDVEGVQLRTVHSAKGLEFPIVIVPELGRGAGGHATITDGTDRFPTDLAYLEEVGGEPILGIKGPDPENPLETTKTPDWTLAEATQAREERAEAKRVLYVATTRARDHLVLSSTHRFEEDAEEEFGPVNTGEDATCWRDWIQPILLEGRGILSDLQTASAVQRDLANSSYRIRRPPEPVPGPDADETEEGEVSIEIPSPGSYPTKTMITATAFRDLVAERLEDPETLSDSAETPERNEPFFTASGLDADLDAAEFGTLVHRLCELELSGVDIDWGTHPYHVVDDPERLTPQAIARARKHVRTGVRCVDEFEEQIDVIETYDELPVTLELDAGRIVGDIDHLTVTEDQYYVTDYKTDSLEDRAVDELAEHYWPQLRVYACALQQSEPKEGVVVRLVFTEDEAIRVERIDATGLERYQTRFEEILVDYKSRA